MGTSIPSGSVQSLWDEACTLLDADTKANLSSLQKPSVDILEQVLEKAQTIRQRTIDEGWKINKPGGGKVAVRDVLENIIKWVDCFKAVADTAVQYDPTHAALPWAAVRFLLQIAVNDVEMFRALTENLEFISRIITRHTISETVYALRKTSASEELRVSLKRLYALVLAFLAKAIKHLDTPGWKRVLRSTTRTAKLFEIQDIVSMDSEVDKLFRLVAAERSIVSEEEVSKAVQLLEHMETPIADLIKRDIAVQKEKKQEEWLEFLTWLSPLDFHAQHRDVSNRRLRNSAEWIVGHREVVEWRDLTTSSVLLIYGREGVGKSMLASKIIDSLSQTQTSTDSKTVYFYCKRSAAEAERQCPRHIMASLLRQVAIKGSQDMTQNQAVLFQHFKNRQKEVKEQGFRLPGLKIQESTELIQETKDLRSLFIVIDALDELEERDRPALVEALCSLVHTARCVVKVLVTGRDDPQIVGLLSGAYQIRIQPRDNDQDMAPFIQHNIDKLKKSRAGVLGQQLSEGFEKRLSSCVQQKAGGMFLWVELQLERLSLAETEPDALGLLETLPPDLSATYEEILTRVASSGPSSSRICADVFKWLLYAKETLTIGALLLAVSSKEMLCNNIDESSLLRICRNLIMVDDTTGEVTFAHSTIREFLLSRPEFDLQICHARIITRCLHMRVQETSDDRSTLPQPEAEFQRYATLYWALHYGDISSVASRELSDQIFGFVLDDDKEPTIAFQFWLQDAYDWSLDLPREDPLRRDFYALESSSSTPLFLACAFNLHSLMAHMDTPRFDWNQPNKRGHTGLYIASVFGHMSIVSFLIGKGANADAKCGRYGSPLHAACFHGHAQVAAKLMENGAQTQCSETIFGDALDAAVKGGNEAVARVIVEHDAPILKLDQERMNSTIAIAGHSGFIDVVNLLQTMRRDQAQSTARQLSGMVQRGQVRQLQRFLKDNPASIELLPSDSVATAALHGHSSMVAFCIQKGLSIESRGQFGSPLCAASLKGHQEIVQVLLGLKADTKDGEALDAASRKGHLSIVQMLIGAANSDTDIHDRNLQRALSSACSFGHLDVVKRLVEAGASISKAQASFRIMEAASDHSRWVVVAFLREAAMDVYGESPHPDPAPLDPFFGA
ncbi:hypothetical protein GCG54_00003357 [Colletotrichum gloeosporioides]|uniref:NACHT domain-containing protein n=1 Tax=Colletotrichum gloeosporioides TaxID=474922 RepID=A0A8H4CF04_COLGL|nr:uncharacterized protein GCG54_00003357 [Colletotrichum gloeosporioides]KAF3802552.1 hypothetical protein GCG54_00003357 [Colletotrichum gloeosporioides]